MVIGPMMLVRIKEILKGPPIEVRDTQIIDYLSSNWQATEWAEFKLVLDELIPNMSSLDRLIDALILVRQWYPFTLICEHIMTFTPCIHILTRFIKDGRTTSFATLQDASNAPMRTRMFHLLFHDPLDPNHRRLEWLVNKKVIVDDDIEKHFNCGLLDEAVWIIKQYYYTIDTYAFYAVYTDVPIADATWHRYIGAYNNPKNITPNTRNKIPWSVIKSYVPRIWSYETFDECGQKLKAERIWTLMVLADAHLTIPKALEVHAKKVSFGTWVSQWFIQRIEPFMHIATRLPLELQMHLACITVGLPGCTDLQLDLSMLQVTQTPGHCDAVLDEPDEASIPLVKRPTASFVSLILPDE
jgi:hypothetical protein